MDPNNNKQTPDKAWELLAGDQDDHTRIVKSLDALRACDALVELQARPGLLVLDDLAGHKDEPAKGNWAKHLKKLDQLFFVSSPVLPVHQRHAENADDLLPIIQSEIRRLRRPLAAVVDMQWVFCDHKGNSQNSKARWFGLELIRLIKRAKPSLPIFVWSPIHDRQILQRAMQLGASSCFDKDRDLAFEHDHDGITADPDNQLDAGGLWFRILEWERTRYTCPPVGSSDGDFILATTPEAVKCRKKFLENFKLCESDLRARTEPPVERLLRALVPEAEGVEILRYFGEGQSRAERPFVVRGRTANGRWLRPVQIKLSKDWRTLAREGKGYRDVFAGCLGPSVAHVLTGPFRLEEWCGMTQSFAAPEEAIQDISAKSTRSLDEWLRKRLPEPTKCVQLVDEVFDGVLDPLYRDNLTKRAKSVFKAFNRASPAHLEIKFVPADEGKKSTVVPVDFTPESLSRKDAKLRREMAYRRWREVEDWWNGKEAEKGGTREIEGLEIESLEINTTNPEKSRLRVLDSTVGIKVDLMADHGEIARRWQALADSPIKLVGLPVKFRLCRQDLPGKGRKSDQRKHLLNGWIVSIEKLLRSNGILERGKKNKSDPKPNQLAWERCSHYFHPIHPVDWSEEFHIGPTHGDLNLGNILLHEKGDSLFPWLIDFDKAEDDRPVVFDLAKLEIEAYHKIAHELFWELRQIGCHRSDSDSRRWLRRFEDALQVRRIADLNHLWGELADSEQAVPDSLKHRFGGLFAYLKQVRKRVDDLGVGGREFLIGRAVYAMCCLKFKHLYQAGTHLNAPFPAKVVLWKLESLIDALDAENGIFTNDEGRPRLSDQSRAIGEAINEVRKARRDGVEVPLMELLSTKPNRFLNRLSELPDYGKDDKWTRLLRLLRDKSLPGGNRWMRELLWYARDYGLSRKTSQLAEFTKAIVSASMPTGEKVTVRVGYVDYASTGRLGNTYPAAEMLKHLAAKPGKPLIKVSSRGESGGTIDILEKAGIPLCRSEETVKVALAEQGWALVETSEALGEVDKILMNLRKQYGCMKVNDLVMTSISGKKWALGIAGFAVQVVTGYDAKIDLPAKDPNGKVTESHWTEMWREVVGKEAGAVTLSTFDSDLLKSWTDNNQNGNDVVVFGKKLLAAKIWADLTEDHRRKLRGRLPVKFIGEMNDLKMVLGWLNDAASTSKESKTPAPVKDAHPQLILNLSQIQIPTHQTNVTCWEHPPPAQDEALRELSVIIFRFGCVDIRPCVNLPFFDGLFTEISQSGHAMASLVFGKQWIAVIRPRSDLPADLQSWCWKVLRHGFDVSEGSS